MRHMTQRAAIPRRVVLAGAAASALLATRRQAWAAGDIVRLGVLQFGTVQWVAETIARDKLDEAHGIVLRTSPLANNDAGRIALMAGAADIVVSDWPFVAAQRAAGTNLVFSPFSLATGGVVVKAGTTVAKLEDLAGKRLGVAGGPVDKSWLVVQAAGKKQGIDLAHAASVVYGAPPLLSAKLAQGELDAVLTFWNYVAILEAAGFREAISVADCAAALGLPARTSLVGFVFRQDWAEAHRAAADGFLDAAREAQASLAAPGPASDAAWDAIRPLMQAKDDAVFARLRSRFVAGIPAPADFDPRTEQRNAQALFVVLRETGGNRATADLDALPDGIFWRNAPMGPATRPDGSG